MVCVPIHGGTEAPRIARQAVLCRLDGQVAAEIAQDAALLVSELVTNSLLHADLGVDDTVLVELALNEACLAITVTDPGSHGLPHLLPLDSGRPHGFGLRLLNDISSRWGVRLHPGALQVWCELALGESGKDRSEAQPPARDR
jgi:two-component sensor histidine kinase